ncbi:MAG: S-layer homology domain-containing protein [Oscillibacter sp.]|nr:S-layer homology domain-containing protein [Oscillibacter sp.]
MKKFISMALALVMTLSLCTFVAAPKAEAAFDDADEFSSKYAVQAIDVIQKIEVMDGYDDNTFKPTAGLTRQAAAKIICNMILGPTTAKALPTNASPFPDVMPDTQWAGYISYCLQQGIISGYSDGTFKGGDPLSGYAYLKMLLGALGYDAEKEGFVGANWKVNVAKTALGIGLDKGISVELDGTTQVTREDAAIYAFNTLQADMVEYDSQNTLEINGVKVTMGGSNAVPQTWNTSSTSADNINNEKSDGQNARPIVQFAERYFDKLERWPKTWDTYTTDDFGRPSIKWAWKGVDIGTYSRDPDVTFVGGVKVNEIYDALRQETGMSSGDDGAYLYINSDVPNNRALDVSRSNDKDLDHSSNLKQNATTHVGTGPDATLNHRVDRIGDGTIIEAYRNDANNHVDVCVISVYGGKVDSVKGATTKKDAYVVVAVNDGNFPERYPDTIRGTGNREFETEDFDEDDVVAFTYSDSAQEIKSMYLMTSEAGALRSKITGKSLNLDGTVYSYGKEYTFDDLLETGLSNKSSYVVYLDENDYVLWIEEDEFSVDDYVLIERITIETTVNNVTTKTASVLGRAETKAGTIAENSQNLQIAYNQSKDAVGNSSWDAQAQVRYPSGARRTITLDDSKNYRTSIASDGTIRENSGNIEQYEQTSAVGVTPVTYGWVVKSAAGAAYGVVNGTTGDDGNWIAEPFTAGHIVRVSSNSNGYRLHSINNNRFYVAYDFSLNSNRLRDTNGNIRVTEGLLNADSETHFVVEDMAQGSYKSYTGVKNTPTIALPAQYVRDANNNQVANPHYNDNSVAYIYHTGGTAKLVFVTNAWDVSNSTNDIVFLVANSTSNLIEADDGEYYEVSAVEKNEIKTVMVKYVRDNRVSFTANNATFTPGVGSTEKEYRCVILNNVSYDSNDFITKGEWKEDDDVTPGRVQGIRRVNDEEVRLNNYGNNTSFLKDVAENVRVYFVDGDNIEQIDYSDIVNDNQDWVYYVEDDGEITYLFIVDYEDDGGQQGTTIIAGSIGFNTIGNVATYHLMPGVAMPSLEDVRVALNNWNTNFTYSDASATEDDNGNTVYTYTRTNKADNSKMVISVYVAFDATEEPSQTNQ